MEIFSTWIVKNGYVIQKGGVIIPAGEHSLNIYSYNGIESINIESAPTLYLEDISGDIISAYKYENSFHVEYQSKGRCYITLSQKPQAVEVDGRIITARVQQIGHKSYVNMGPCKL